MDKECVVKNLKSLRLERGISQQELADAVDVSQSSINKYENRNVEPDLAVLKDIAVYFGTSIDYLIGFSSLRQRAEEIGPLTQQEEDLLKHYRMFSPARKNCVDVLAETLSDEEKTE